MISSKFLFILVCFLTFVSTQAVPTNSKLFREYIGAESKNVTFDQVPINHNVEFHFILSFAIDYTNTSSPSPTNGHFNIFWDTDNLTPSQVSSIKSSHSNVKVALSLGGDTVNGQPANFTPSSVDSWVQNAVVSLTSIIEKYNLDGIDIDYEHFIGDPNTFTECIGQLVVILKQKKVIKFASIAPYANETVQSYYIPLWKKYGHFIDYVNFQFYAYEKGISVSEFLRYFEIQRSNYKGSKILVSFGTDNSGGLSPKNGFFKACRRLQSRGKLDGIFIWSADDSKSTGFPNERLSQLLLATPRCSLEPFSPCDVAHP